MKKVYIESLGCPKNLVDSELIAFLLSKNNLKIVKHHRDADMIIVNTCGFMKDAKQESIQYILDYKHATDKQLIVTGCMVNLYKKDLIKSIPEIKRFYTTEEFFNKYFQCSYSRALHHGRYYSLTPKSYTYIKISDGCNHKCSFCTIPLIKGKQFSRPIKNIIAEIRQKAEAGFKEFNLIAQDTLNFGKDNQESLSFLLYKIDKLHEDIKIRLLYLFPDKKLIDIIKQISDSKKIINYADIPVQHFSEKILKLMKRPYSRGFYYDLFNKIKKINPQFILRSTFIIGFPGEKAVDHKELLHSMEEIKFNWAGFFLYSDENLADSSRLPDKPSAKTMMRRMEQAVSLQREITSEWLSTRIGMTYHAVVDKIVESNHCLLARSSEEAPEIDGNIIVKYNKKYKVGDKLKVKIKRSFDYDLEGIVL